MSQKMHVNYRPKIISFSLKTLGAAVVSALLVSGAYAAGLGKLTVLSSLGQPLHAEIELTSVAKDEVGSLTVKLASTEAFRQANIEFNPALFALRFAVEQRGGRQFIRVTSNQPMNEPFVDMLLEVGGANSRLVREYTFLLDPADLRRTQPAQVAAPGGAASSANRAPQPQAITRSESVPQPAVVEKPISPDKSQQQAPAKRVTAVQPKSDAKNAAEEYQVKKGDTLSKIAGQTKAEGVSLDQMLVALQRANPNAFAGNNINRLRTGQILSLPDAETARGVSNSEAKGIVVAQAADFNSYRNKLAGQVAGAAPQKSDEAKQSATGKITAKVEEQPNVANEAKDKLKLSKSGVSAATGNDKAGGIAAGTEEKIAKDKALAEANARVKELEKNVSDLQKILEIKNKGLADRQKQATVAKADIAPVAPATAPVSVSKPSAALASAPVPATGSSPAAASAPAASAPTPAAVSASASAPAAASASVASGSAAEAKPATSNKPAVTPAKPKPVAPVASPPEPSLLDELLDNPLLMALPAVLLAGLAAFGVYGARRRKQRKEFQDSNILSDSSLKANSLFGSTGGQSVDTNNSVFNSNFAPSASQLDTNEVDPVAEADVYIAYGRDAQAEEILKEALRTQPERNAVRVKLLEIYANRKDTRAFEILASELYSMTKGEGEDWAQAVNLGMAIDPKNPLYAGGRSPEAVAAKAAAITAPTQPLDELDLEALLNTTQGANTSLENLNTVEAKGSYFDNTVRATEVSIPGPESALGKIEVDSIQAPPVSPAPVSAAAPAPASAPEAGPSTGLDFDFDLAGLGIKEVALPPTAHSAPLPELKSDSGTMDFDLHDDGGPSAADGHDNEHVKTSLVTDDFAPLQIDIPNVPDTTGAQHEPTPAPNALDFDLSGITLDLNPTDTKPAVAEDTFDAGGEHSNVAEMATKLDLALAYQEIGDKEGARELLDEVVKGGTAEQADKAKSMLQKLA